MLDRTRPAYGVYGTYGVYLYVPVIHEGIRRWLLRHGEASFVALVGPETLNRYRPIVKDIRRLPIDDAKVALRALHLSYDLRILEFDELQSLDGEVSSLVMPKDELMVDAAQYLPASVSPIFESAFLRWDDNNVFLSDPQPSHTRPTVRIGSIWDDLEDLTGWSPDWWRQVASALVVGGDVVVAEYNQPMPSEEAVLIRGDPRALFNKGVQIELSSYLHAEAHVVAEAARRGIATDGADLYVTTFPCSTCAKLLAATEIARIYYRNGYSMLDGESVLIAAGIEIIHVI